MNEGGEKRIRKFSSPGRGKPKRVLDDKRCRTDFTVIETKMSAGWDDAMKMN